MGTKLSKTFNPSHTDPDVGRPANKGRLGRVPDKQPVPTDHRMPFRNVSFPSDVIEMKGAQTITSADFLAIPDQSINEAIRDSGLKARRVLVEGAQEPQKALQLPDGRVVVVVPFVHPKVVDTGEAVANYPMTSPSERHVYLDAAQWRNAVAHGSYRQAVSTRMRSDEANAGYNNTPYPKPPEDTSHDVHFGKARP